MTKPIAASTRSPLLGFYKGWHTEQACGKMKEIWYTCFLSENWEHKQQNVVNKGTYLTSRYLECSFLTWKGHKSDL